MSRKIYVEMSQEAREAYELLKRSSRKFDKQLLKAIDRVIAMLKQKYQFGDQIPRNLIPKKYLEFGINNLWRVELPDYWRLLYTLRGNRLEVISFILEWVDHKNYNKLFGYRN